MTFHATLAACLLFVSWCAPIIYDTTKRENDGKKRTNETLKKTNKTLGVGRIEIITSCYRVYRRMKGKTTVEWVCSQHEDRNWWEDEDNEASWWGRAKERERESNICNHTGKNRNQWMLGSRWDIETTGARILCKFYLFCPINSCFESKFWSKNLKVISVALMFTAKLTLFQCVRFESNLSKVLL